MRYEYDAYGSLEKETDLANGRIDHDQYDMTGRLVRSSTLEKNTEKCRVRNRQQKIKIIKIL